MTLEEIGVKLAHFRKSRFTQHNYGCETIHDRRGICRDDRWLLEFKLNPQAAMELWRSTSLVGIVHFSLECTLLE